MRFVMIVIQTSRVMMERNKTEDEPTEDNTTGKKNIEIEDQVYNSWQKIGTAEGLATDTEIANFLIQQYENVQMGAQPATHCIHCHSHLTLVCTKCYLAPKLRASRAKTQTASTLVSRRKKALFTPGGKRQIKSKRRPKGCSYLCADFDGQELNLNQREIENSTHAIKLETYDTSGSSECAVKKAETDDGDDALPVAFESSMNKVFDRFEETQTETRSKADDARHFSCSNCVAAFRWKQSLREHMQKVHSVKEVFPCKMCDRSFTSYLDVKQHMQNHEKPKPVKKHFCTECDAAFVKAWDLKLHMRRHTGERPFVCSVCTSGFKTKDKLKIHMRCHTGERPYICEECGATFRQSGILQSHMRTHTGEKPYICKECGVAFAQSSALKTHIRIHTGEKSHMCTVCGAAFAASSRLDRHMRVHTGDRPYVCSECGSAFKSSRELACHTRTHTKYKPAVCKVCGSSFSQVGYLKIHMRVHTGEKPYICEVCSMAFRQPSGLKMHMLKHTDEKPCVCKVCGAAFRRSDTLKNHMQKKHVEGNLTNTFV